MATAPMNLLATLWSGLRAVLLRPPRVSLVDGTPARFLALVLVYLGVTFGLAMKQVAPPWTLIPYGITTVLTDALLTLAAAWAIVRILEREAILWSAASVLLAATIATAVVVHWPLGAVASVLARGGHWAAAIVAEFFSSAWWFFVLLAAAHWLAPKRFARVVVAALVGYAISAATWWWLPSMPVLATARVETPETTPDEGDASADESPTPDFDAEQVIYNQPTLVDAAAAKLAPETPGRVDLYVVAFAGDGSENVFRNEAEYVERLFANRFRAEGRVLVLENNPATVETRPLATLTNLTWALDDVAKKMNPAEDVLLLYLTTHGSSDHELLVDLDPLPLDQIGPDDLAEALKTSPAIRWKAVVVNACYSGGFVDALRDDSTMVIASARSDRTSFGCGVDSDITYFGKAFLAEALNRTTSIREAFDLAKTSVAAWEEADHEEHSEPQIASTRSIEGKLDAWRRTLSPGAPVPFEPAETGTAAAGTP